MDLVSFDTSSLLSAELRVCMTYPVQFNGVNPLVSVLWVLCSQVPHTVIYTNVQPALIKLMRLKNKQTEKKVISHITVSNRS